MAGDPQSTQAATSAPCVLASMRGTVVLHRFDPVEGRAPMPPDDNDSDPLTALAVSTSGHIWAMGTQGGLLRWGWTTHCANAPSGSPGRWRLLGETVRTVCEITPDRWATGDDAGRVLIWSQNASPQALPNPHGQPTALASVEHDGGLIGLTQGGQLCTWDLPSNRLIQTIEGPPAQTPGFLTRWPSADLWVWPTAEGELATCDTKHHRFGTHRLHKGGVLAALVIDDMLCTVGRSDRRICAWRSLDDDPFREFRVDLDPIFVAIAGVEPIRWVIVDANGGASLWVMDSAGARRVTTIEGNSYFAVVSPGWKTHVLNERRRRQDRAAILVGQVQSGRGNHSGGIESLHDELRSIGFEPVSLALRSEACRVNGDVAGELARLHQLIQIDSHDGSDSQEMRHRYFELLDITGLGAEIKGSLSLQSGVTARQRADQVVRSSTPAPEWVIEPRVPLRVVWFAAQRMKLELTQRYLVRRLDAITIECDGVNPDELLRRLNAGRQGLTEATASLRVDLVTWAPQQSNETTSLIVAAATGQLTGLELGLCQAPSSNGCTLELVVLLNTAALCPTEGLTADADTLGLPKLPANRWLAAMHRWLTKEMRSWLTEFGHRSETR